MMYSVQKASFLLSSVDSALFWYCHHANSRKEKSGLSPPVSFSRSKTVSGVLLSSASREQSAAVSRIAMYSFSNSADKRAIERQSATIWWATKRKWPPDKYALVVSPDFKSRGSCIKRLGGSSDMITRPERPGR